MTYRLHIPRFRSKLIVVDHNVMSKWLDCWLLKDTCNSAQDGDLHNADDTDQNNFHLPQEDRILFETDSFHHRHL